MNGYLNKQNWRHWGTGNPHLSVASPLHAQKITVSCVISSNRTIGPIFIDCMVTGVKYRELLDHYFDPENNMASWNWFIQACLHRAADVFTWLEATFDEHLIALVAEKFTGHGIEWTPYIPDVNQCDFFLWVTSKIESIGNLQIHWCT